MLINIHDKRSLRWLDWIEIIIESISQQFPFAMLFKSFRRDIFYGIYNL